MGENVKKETHDEIEKELQECFEGVVKEGKNKDNYIIDQRSDDCFLKKVTDNETILKKLQSCWRVIVQIEDENEE